MSICNHIGVDLFSGAGGLSRGAEMAGIQVAVAIEQNKYAVETFEYNHTETKVILADVRDIDVSELSICNPFIVFGGPPCQGFSKSNTITRNTKNPKNSLFEEFVRLVNELQPKWFLFENVEGIISFNKGKTVERMKEMFENIGYSNIVSKVLWADDYGVPQRRNRFFMVGNNQNIIFNFPEPELTKVTVSEAISDLPSLKNGDKIEKMPYKKIAHKKLSNYAKKMRKKSKFATQNIVSRNQDYVLERYKYIKQGENWRVIPEHLMKNYKDKSRCHSGIYKRLDANKPSVVIANYRKNMLIHPFEDRGLSIREAARLQSFPDDFIFKGTIMYQQQQIGNAVPPLLAQAIFTQIIKCSNGKK